MKQSFQECFSKIALVFKRKMKKEEQSRRWISSIQQLASTFWKWKAICYHLSAVCNWLHSFRSILFGLHWVWRRVRSSNPLPNHYWKGLRSKINFTHCSESQSLLDIRQNASHCWSSSWSVGRIASEWRHIQEVEKKRRVAMKGDDWCFLASGYITETQMMLFLRPSFTDRVELKAAHLRLLMQLEP